jgi:hypothetical protein
MGYPGKELWRIMTTYEEPGEELLQPLRDDAYDVTHGIAPAEHEHVSVRRFEHDGHSIEIHTQYRILIDGQEFPDPIHVAGDGSVSYHGLPQYSAPSAVDLVRLIVERLVEDEPPPLIGGSGPEPAHHHDHHHPEAH